MDCFGEGAGTINHNQVNCWPPTATARLYEILYSIVWLDDCHEETPRLLHILLRKNNVSHAMAPTKAANTLRCFIIL